VSSAARCVLCAWDVFVCGQCGLCVKLALLAVPLTRHNTNTPYAYVHTCTGDCTVASVLLVDGGLCLCVVCCPTIDGLCVGVLVCAAFTACLHYRALPSWTCHTHSSQTCTCTCTVASVLLTVICLCVLPSLPACTTGHCQAGPVSPQDTEGVCCGQHRVCRGGAGRGGLLCATQPGPGPAQG
jgi:hypothetical protein